MSITATPATEKTMEAGVDPAFVAEGSITGIMLTVASNEEIVMAPSSSYSSSSSCKRRKIVN
jgi:hypothetical protein